MTSIHQTPYHHVTRRDGALTMVRSAATYPDMATLESEYRALVLALAPYKRSGMPLLVDLRKARGRNDADFERALEKWRRRSLEGHEPLVALVQSTLGKMHVERHMRADGLRAWVTTDPEEALRLLQERP